MPYLQFDKRRFQQVLLNLLQNAVKFTNEGKISIKAKLVERVDGIVNNLFLVVSVEDNGIGMTELEIQ